MNDHHSRLNSSCKHDALETINNIPGDIISDTLFNFKNYMVATSNGNNKSVKFLVECHSRVKTSTKSGPPTRFWKGWGKNQGFRRHFGGEQNVFGCLRQ